MENNNVKLPAGMVAISVEEYRNLLSKVAGYETLKEVIKAGVHLSFIHDGELSMDSSAEDIILKFVLGDAYQATVSALKDAEAAKRSERDAEDGEE